MVEFFGKALLVLELASLAVGVVTLYVMIEVVKYKEAKHGANLPEGLPKKG